jgi:hypothetical protein
MRPNGAAATLVVAAFFLCPVLAFAQASASGDSAPATGRRQTISIRSVYRRYSVDTTRVSEQVGDLEYAHTAGRTRLRLSISPLRFSDRTTTVTGALPAELLADVRVGTLDTIRMVVQGPSVPGSLSANQVTALGSVGTGTLDLESAALGTTTLLGVRTTIAGAAGPAIVALRFGADFEPTPSGADSVYWRGITLRGGASLTAFAGEFRLTFGVDVSRSDGTPLNGRNLFPGGGSVVVRGDASGLVGTSATLLNVSAFYFRPFDLDQPVQANRLLPTGDFMGLSVAFLVPAGSLFLSPAFAVAREASRASVPPPTSLDVLGDGWSTSGSLGLDVPLGRGVSLTPEFGVVLGTVTGKLTLPNRPDLPLSSFADRISGWWGAVELSASF